jgi:AcrR family transcriptional regulator
MGRPRHANGQRTRQAILDASLELFAKKGYFGTSLRDIAAAVGIRESALYNYFRGKEALFEAIVLADWRRKEQTLSSVIDQPVRDVQAMLTEVAIVAVEHFSTRRQQQLFCILISDRIRHAKEGRINLFDRMSNGHGQLHTMMRRLIRERKLRGVDPHLLAMEFVGPLLLWRHLRATRSSFPMLNDPPAFARRHVEQFLQGAAVRSARTRRLDSESKAPRSKRLVASRSVRDIGEARNGR